MKTVEEFKSLRGEVETLNKKLAELTVEELAQVFGGSKVMLNDFIRKLADKYFDIDADQRCDIENKWKSRYPNMKEEDQ